MDHLIAAVACCCLLCQQLKGFKPAPLLPLQRLLDPAHLCVEEGPVHLDDDLAHHLLGRLVHAVADLSGGVQLPCLEIEHSSSSSISSSISSSSCMVLLLEYAVAQCHTTGYQSAD